MQAIDWKGFYGFQLLATLLLTAPAAVAHADGAEQLRAYLRGLSSLQGSFEQELLDESGELLETLRGEVAMQRPGRFRWETLTPYRQLVLVDGETLWLYEPELQQATRRAARAALEYTPAAVLLDEDALDRYFSLRALPEAADGAARVELQAQQVQEGGYQRLILGLKQARLHSIEFTDPLGRLTRIRFDALRRNANPAADLFRFTPPPGVEVLRADPPPAEHSGGR